MKPLIALLLVLTAVPAFSAPFDWRYEARICGNMMVADSENEIIRAERIVRRQGCTEVNVVPVVDGAVLVYGVKVVRGVEY